MRGVGVNMNISDKYGAICFFKAITFLFTNSLVFLSVMPFKPYVLILIIFELL